MVDVQTSEDRKQRNSHTRGPWETLLKSIVSLIRESVVNIDILLEPALSRCAYPPLPIFPPEISLVAIENLVQQLDAHWPERTFSVADLDLHISSHPLIAARILYKFYPTSVA